MINTLYGNDTVIPPRLLAQEKMAETFLTFRPALLHFDAIY